MTTKGIIIIILCVTIITGILYVFYNKQEKYHYEIKYYSEEQIEELFNNNKEQFNKAKDILLTNNSIYNLREQYTSTYTIFDTSLKKIKKYLSNEDFYLINDFYKDSGICLIARQSNVVYFTFCLEELDRKPRHYTIYYIPKNVEIGYYSKWNDEFNNLEDNWHYGIYIDKNI